jgi:fumarylacetoacetase
VESWVPVPPDSEFPLANLPLGAFSVGGDPPRVGCALGDRIVDCAALANARPFTDALADAARTAERSNGGGAPANEADVRALFGRPNLNAFLAAGRPTWRAVRAALQAVFDIGAPAETRERVAHALVAQHDATLHCPVAPGDYVDFYSSLEHATNVGRIFRPSGEPLLPNYRHLPVGYHGRAGTVIASGTPIRRPRGQRLPPGGSAPLEGPTDKLDFELELGFVVGPGNALGTPIPTCDAREHIFGFALLNDWSARDLQAWEYQPLGPFTSKAFATTLGAWVVPLDALEPFRVAGPAQEPPPLPYLQVDEPWAFDITLAVRLETASGASVEIARTSFAGMYWNAAQQLAHLSHGGARVRPGDLFGSGTISGSAPGTYGSLIEIARDGAQPLRLDGEERTYLADGDTVVMRAWAERSGLRIGFGELRGTIVPSA